MKYQYDVQDSVPGNYKSTVYPSVNTTTILFRLQMPIVNMLMYINIIKSSNMMIMIIICDIHIDNLIIIDGPRSCINFDF